MVGELFGLTRPWKVASVAEISPMGSSETAGGAAALGVEWSNANLYLRGNGYANRFDDFIETRLVGDSSDIAVYTYDNVNDGFTRGVELDVLGLPAGTISDVVVDGFYLSTATPKEDPFPNDVYGVNVSPAAMQNVVIRNNHVVDMSAGIWVNASSRESTTRADRSSDNPSPVLPPT